MTRRVLPGIVLAPLVMACILLLARPAEGTSGPGSTPLSPKPAAISLSVGSTTVSGRPVTVLATVRDGAGQPVPGALLRLIQRTTFFGKQQDMVLDEASTDQEGRAELSFSPDQGGRQSVAVQFAGTPQLGAAEASMAFDVRQPIVAYHKAPLGVGGPWARSYLILIPLFGVWVTYATALRQARKLWRAGARRSSAPPSMNLNRSVPA